MVKTNLPVILLKDIALLPNNEMRLEFDNDNSKNIVDFSELFHEGNVLVVSMTETFNEVLTQEILPEVGVVSKITNKIDLPNGKTRVIIKAKERAKIFEYLNLNKGTDVLEAIISEINFDENNLKDENVLIEKINRELEDYVSNISYASNSILATTKKIDDLGKLVDVIAPTLPINFIRLCKYINVFDKEKRAELLLEDLYKQKQMYEIELNIDQKVRKELDNNQKEYLLREKMKVIKEELGESSLKDSEIDKLKKEVENLNVNLKIKDRLNKEILRYETLPQASPEVNVVRNYLDWMTSLPWNVNTEDEKNLLNVKKHLDESHFGLEKVKERIIEFLAVKQITNSLNGPIICLVGPPGVGKTSMAYSIAKAMNRNFSKISVGGVNDESEIIGHRRTYLGSSPGRIIQSLKKAGSSNPIFLIDEIDKMTKDFKGDPASVFLEILDPEQNKFFSDNYIEEEFDLSNVMFIATANYIEQIPEALRDRLEIVKLSGYTEYEKLDIARKHLIPKISKAHGVLETKLEFTNNVLLEIIRSYTKESGVRELERQISKVIRKIVTASVMNKKEVEHKLVTKKDLKNYLGNKIFRTTKALESKIGVVNGLAYTSFGGDTLPIEVNFYKGDGKLVLTGSLGDVMKESAHIALSYIKAHAKELKINYELILKNDIHIHVPEGAIKKDGPSAGITLTTALISAFSNLKVPCDVAMTGEITLRGKVLPIGGLKEKSIGAQRNGIKKIIIPYDNLNDLDEIPTEIKKDIKYIPVKTYDEVYMEIYGTNK